MLKKRKGARGCWRARREQEGTEGLIQWLSTFPSLWHECIRGSRTRGPAHPCFGGHRRSATPLGYPSGIYSASSFVSWPIRLLVRSFPSRAPTRGHQRFLSIVFLKHAKLPPRKCWLNRFFIPFPSFFRHEKNYPSINAHSSPRDYISRVSEPTKKRKERKETNVTRFTIHPEEITRIRFLSSRPHEFPTLPIVPRFNHPSCVPGRKTNSKWKTFRRGLDDRSKSIPPPFPPEKHARRTRTCHRKS